MEFINEKLKSVYIQMYKELKPLATESICDMIYDVCAKDPEFWNLSDDKDGSIQDGYFNAMILFIESLN